MNTATRHRRLDALPEIDRPGDFHPLTSADLALARLSCAFMTARRNGLEPWHVAALADRIAAGDVTDADRDLIAAFGARDPVAAGVSGLAFVTWWAESARACGALPRPADDMGDMTDKAAVQQAAQVIRETIAVLRDRFQELPDDDELSRLGSLLKSGTATPADLAVIEATPGEYIRGRVSSERYALFVNAQLWDY